jgi:hypothetical protein
VQPKLLRRENHQERFSRPLEVPDQALPRVACENALDDLVGGLELLVAVNDDLKVDHFGG